MYDDAQDALAAEYVLGTLSGDEREHAEALLAIDPGFAESVRLWERRLGELNVMVEAVEPPPAVWQKISAAIGHAPAPSVAPSSVAAIAAAIPPVEPAPVPSADAAAVSLSETPLTMAVEEPTAPPDSELPAAGELPRSVSDSVTASLAKSLEVAPSDSEPLATPPPPPQPRIERSAEVVVLARRARHWRNVAVGMQAIAALLAVYVAAAQFYPGLIPLRNRIADEHTAAAPAPPQLGARLVGVLQQDPTAPAFLLTLDPQNRTMIVRRVSATPEPGRSYQLWLIAKQQSAPQSLGVVGNDEFTQRPIPASFDLATLRSASYAVSLEPEGGSPKDVPTGPVLFTGNIVEAVPPPPRT